SPGKMNPERFYRARSPVSRATTDQARATERKAQSGREKAFFSTKGRECRPWFWREENSRRI
ncbi:MAG TPA: hypothetical protein VMU10_09915, partial [Desulfomonilia bacterium]|nr:hypothetical protein [Desulfomonilia bacterium]